MHIIISAIGLTGRDLGFLKNIFRLSPKLQNECRFVGMERRRAAGRLADVVFINEDDPEAVALWAQLSPENPVTTPIMVTSRQSVEAEGHFLHRPLVLKRVLEVLERVTATSRQAQTLARIPSAELSVLVVDDSFPVRKYMETRLHELSSASLSLDFAASGEEALRKSLSTDYDLIFLDVVMPGADGYQVCKKIKAFHSGYVVMLTSRKSPFDKVRGAMSGCDAYLTKPPQDERLKRALETGLTRQRKVRQLQMDSGTALSA